MRLRAFAPADAGFAALLLLVLALLAFRGLMTVGEGSGFHVRSEDKVHSHLPSEVAAPVKNLRVNPNRADAHRLATLPGIGPALAEAIVRFREVHGPFRHLSDLQGVPGIGAKRLQKMLPHLTLREEAAWSTK
ncbi:MAG: helix-hairpin-helix domain-containing protein [candidate division NC10 bacterium]|nr:helix-hairpin-helix domain-containing protein [candidate division NC10 bacterium]MCH7897129.1 helix-hairpin-helix domain-containing protein [candidate division NC10 bacterium]MCZ6551898.1 helix-hairpin-helix domain-containing protein [candidate division NC10 bacterium]